MSTEYCPVCGHHGEPHDLFCRACGGALTDAARAAGPIAEAESLVSRGMLAEAIATVQRAIGQADARDLHVALATLYMRRGGAAEARRELDAALALDPENAVAHAYVGGMLLDKGLVAEAQERLDLAVRLAPNDLIILMKRAEYWLRLGIFSNARAEITRGLQDGGGAPHVRAMAEAMLAAIEKRSRNSFTRQMVSLPSLTGFKRMFGRSDQTAATPTEAEVSR
jgi:tetratricopeptide (TPR) repeat protein